MKIFCVQVLFPVLILFLLLDFLLEVTCLNNKLLKTFSLAVKNNPILLRNNFFSTDFIPLSIFFNLLANLLCSSSASFNDKYPSFKALKKQ